MISHEQRRRRLSILPKEQGDGSWVVAVAGEIDRASIWQIDETIEAIDAVGAGGRIRLDLTDVTFADPVLLATLDRHRIEVLDPSPPVSRLLALARQVLPDDPEDLWRGLEVAGPLDDEDGGARAVSQLEDELAGRAWAHVQLSGRTSSTQYRPGPRAAALLLDLVNGQMRRAELVRLLFPTAPPDEGDSWWHTPLGQLLSPPRR